MYNIETIKSFVIIVLIQTPSYLTLQYVFAYLMMAPCQSICIKNENNYKKMTVEDSRMPEYS